MGDAASEMSLLPLAASVAAASCRMRCKYLYTRAHRSYAAYDYLIKLVQKCWARQLLASRVVLANINDTAMLIIKLTNCFLRDSH